MERWVHLETTSGFALSATEKFVFACCSNGNVHVLKASNFEYVATLPRPAPTLFKKERTSKKYPAAICAQGLGQKYLIVVYGDRSIYVWDVRDSSRIVRVRSFIHHSGCIWDVETFRYKNCESFATCSVDGTFRVWTTDSSKKSYRDRDERWKSQYSRNLMRTVHVLDSSTVVENPTDMEVAPPSIAGHGLRCLAKSENTLKFVVGDKRGYIYSFDLEEETKTTTAKNDISIHSVSAHDAEVLSLAYAGDVLVSSSRDRLVHVFRDLKCTQTLDNHTSMYLWRKCFACV